MRTILAAALLLASCDAPADRPTNAALPDPAAQIAALGDGERNGVFIRAIRDADQECQGVDASRVIGEVGARTAWVARCRGGTKWVIVPGPARAAQVFSLDEARGAGLVRTGS